MWAVRYHQNCKLWKDFYQVDSLSRALKLYRSQLCDKVWVRSMISKNIGSLRIRQHWFWLIGHNSQVEIDLLYGQVLDTRLRTSWKWSQSFKHHWLQNSFKKKFSKWRAQKDHRFTTLSKNTKTRWQTGRVPTLMEGFRPGLRTGLNQFTLDCSD